MITARHSRGGGRFGQSASRGTLAVTLALLAVGSPGAAATPGQPVAPATPQLCGAAVSDIAAAISSSRAQGSPGALIEVAQKGVSLFGAGYGEADVEHAVPLTRDTVFPLASLTKMFTAAAILKLHEQGRLALDAPVSTILPGMPPGLDAVRIYDLLVQTSGIPDFANDAETLRTQSVSRSRAEMLALAIRMAQQPHFAPGTRWEYSNTNYVLLGAIIEQVTGTDLAGAYAALLFTPAGLSTIRLDNPADVVPHRARGYRRDPAQPSGFANAAWLNPSIPGAAGGLRGTAQDLVRWSKALFAGPVLRGDTVALMRAPGRLKDGRTTRAGMPQDWQDGLRSDYAMGLFVREDTPGGIRLSHSGDIDGFSTWFAYYPASGVTIVQMINSQSANLEAEQVEAAVFRKGRRPCLEARR